MIVLLLACGGVGLDPTNPKLDSGSSVVIERLEPDWGPPDGGTEVSIIGEGFEGAVTVSFGDLEVPSTRIDPGTLLIATPYLGFEAAVDVSVTSELGSATLAGGFTYANSAPPDDTGGGGGDDTGGGGDDTGQSGTGLSGGLVELNLMQIACPDCLGYTSDMDISAAAKLHAPVRGSWLGWLPNSGSCALNPSPTTPTSDGLDAGEWLYLTSGSVSIGMRRSTGSSGFLYQAAGLSNSDYNRTAQYKLAADGGSDISSFDIQNALLTPQGFVSIEPQEMLYTQSASAFAARISRSGQRFTWSNSGGSGTFVILVDAYDGRTGNYSGSVLCHGPDNGAMQVPGGYLGSFQTGSLLVISLIRYQISEVTRPTDGATIETVGKVGVMGTGLLVP